MTTDARFTLMTTHAHPDDETIGTGGVMAKAVRDGHRVVLVTNTRGEMGEIVVKDLDTPENHRRLGEIRMAELEAAMGDLGVTEWENLGYRDSDMMGRRGNLDARSFWQANLDEAARRLVWLVRTHQPHVITTYNDFGGYGHPDHIRTHDVALLAWQRSWDPAWYPEQLAPEHGGTGPSVEDGGLAPWTPLKLYEQAIPASVRKQMWEAQEASGQPNRWAPPPDATPEQIAEMQAQMERMLTPDDQITTWIDVSDVVEQKWAAINRHVTQMSPDSFFLAGGIEGWRKFWSQETFVLREARIAVDTPETDLFAGLPA